MYYEFIDEYKIDIAGVGFKSKSDRLWGGVSLGGMVNVADESVSLYGEVGGRTSLENWGDSYVVDLTVGLRLAF